MDLLISFSSWLLIIIGSVFLIIGAIGIIRLPDMYSRMHGAGIIDTLGASALILGMILQAGMTMISVKLVIILLFLIFTSPTTTHALARAALDSGLKPFVGDQNRGEKTTNKIGKEVKKERKQKSKT